MNIFMRLGSIYLIFILAGCASQGVDGDMGSDDEKNTPLCGGSGGEYLSPTCGGSGGGVRGLSTGAGVTITKPVAMADVTSPVEVCMETKGYVVEPAKKGVNEGKGHHHLIVDVELPDLSKPVPKDSQHIHMGDGSSCKTIELSPGKMHTIQALFAKGNHIPYDPPVTDSVVVFVK